jgi:hypothetical protein
MVENDEFGATFLAARNGGYLEETALAGKDGWVPTTLVDCQVVPFTTSSPGNASWRLDPSFPKPSAQSTEIHILVTEEACASGSSPAGRILPPVASYQDQSLTIDIAIRGIGIATCPSNPSLPVTIVLPEALGDRQLVGASDI